MFGAHYSFIQLVFFDGGLLPYSLKAAGWELSSMGTRLGRKNQRYYGQSSEGLPLHIPLPILYSSFEPLAFTA